MEECTDPEVPIFDLRESFSPLSDKENRYPGWNDHDDLIRDFGKWGPLYRSAIPEPSIPLPSKRSAKWLPRKPKKENKQNGDSSLAMAMKSGTRKRTNASQFGFDSFGRLPPHLRMSRDYLPMLDFPENLQQLEAASADWKTFEDWQIVMSTAFLQGLPPASNGVPASAATSCDVVSYVTSTVNPKYRQSRDCQLRMKTLRLREEKDSNAELVAPLKKKKKSRGDENTAFDKLPIPVPKRTALSLQDDNNRTRTQVYKDIFNCFRNSSFLEPVYPREYTFSRSNSATAYSALFQESGINLDVPVDPFDIMKKRQERCMATKSFLNESTLRLAQSLGLTVDSRGIPVSSQLLSPMTKTSILQQTLQSNNPPRSPLTPGPVMFSGSGSRPLPSPHFIAAAPNLPRRSMFAASTTRASPAPAPGSPLPSLSSDAISRFIGNVTSGMITGTPVSTISAVAPPVSVAQTPQTKVVQQPAAKIQQLKQWFASRGEGVGDKVLDAQKVKDFLHQRNISCTDQQINELMRAFASKMPHAQQQQVPENVSPQTQSSGGVTVVNPSAMGMSAATLSKANSTPVPIAPGVRITPATWNNQNQTINLNFNAGSTQNQAAAPAQVVRAPAVRKNGAVPSVAILRNGPVVPQGVVLPVRTSALPQLIPNGQPEAAPSGNPTASTLGPYRINESQFKQLFGSSNVARPFLHQTSAGTTPVRNSQPVTGISSQVPHLSLSHVNTAAPAPSNVFAVSSANSTGPTNQPQPGSLILQAAPLPLHLQSAPGADGIRKDQSGSPAPDPARL